MTSEERIKKIEQAFNISFTEEQAFEYIQERLEGMERLLGEANAERDCWRERYLSLVGRVQRLAESCDDDE